MAVVPTPGDGVGTGILDTADLNEKFTAAINFLQNLPAAELRQSSAQTIATATFTAITFNAFDLDDDLAGTGGHDTVTNNSRFTAQYPGWYRISGGIAFANSTTGVRIGQIRVNGTAVNGSRAIVPAASSGVHSMIVTVRTKQVFLNVLDYVELYGYQDTGGNLNTDATTDLQSSMSVCWVRLA